MGESSESTGAASGTKRGECFLHRKPKAIAFDLDGTLVDSVDYMANTWLQLARSMGLEPKMDVRELVGMTGLEIAKILTGGDEALIAKIAAKRREYFSVERYVKNVRLFPDSVRVLAELKRMGCKMALASSTTAGRIRTIAGAFEIDGYFDVIVGGDEVERSKPAPDLVTEAAKRLNVKVSELAYVGDTSYDVEAAIKADAISVLVLRGRRAYSGPEPHLRLADLAGLLPFARAGLDCVTEPRCLEKP
jgi:HAD superfamily hydrolase (TIGR01509 family)